MLTIEEQKFRARLISLLNELIEKIDKLNDNLERNNKASSEV